VILSCPITAVNGSYTWLLNGEMIPSENTKVYQIEKLKQSDRGIYMCNATMNVLIAPLKIEVFSMYY